MFACATAFAEDEKKDVKPEEKLPIPEFKVDASPLPPNSPGYAPIVQKVAPSVVTISTSKVVRDRGQNKGQYGNNPLFNDPNFRRYFGIPDNDGNGRGNPDADDDQDAPAQPQKGKRKGHKQALGLGSGVIVSPDGYIITNNHVVDGADDITVTIGSSSHEYPAKKIGTDPSTDVAVIKIDAKDLPAVTFADSDKLHAGDIVLAVGNPFGLTQSATMGVVSAVGRGGMGIVDYENFIQTDASINMGNSGGALVDIEGRLVGINTAIFSRSGGNQGIGFAVPANLARGVMESLLKTGSVQRGFLGVVLQPLDDDLVREFKLVDDHGALIAELQSGSPAEKAGLKNGDVVLTVNDKKVNGPRELQLMIGSMAPGAKANLKLISDGQEKSVTVELGERPTKGLAAGKPTPSDDEPDVLDGVTVADLDAESRKELKLPENATGVVIVQIDPDSPSAAAGIQKGDVVLEINRVPITDSKQAVEMSEKLKTEKKVLIRVQSHGKTRYAVIERK